MKLSQLHPCDSCGEGLLRSKDGTRYALFYLVTVDRALIRPGSANRVASLAQYFGGNLQMAEIMGPDADDAVAVASKDVPEVTKDELMVCQRCYMTVPMGVISTKYSLRQAEAEELAERASRENGDPING